MPNLTKSELDDLKDQINTFHQKGIEAAKWGIVYFINAGEGLHVVRAGLPSRTFKPWLEDNFDGSRQTAYRYLKLAENKDRIKELSVTLCYTKDGDLQEISLRKAFSILGVYVEDDISAEVETSPITAIQTPESPSSAGRPSMPPAAPASPKNGAGGSPVYNEAEQAILDRLLKPGEMAGFESGLDLPDEYECYLCANWFFADQMRRIDGNRYCYSCREQLPDPAGNDQGTPQEARVYETTLFDESTPALEPETAEAASANGRAPATDVAPVAPPAMTQKDPYDEMLELASELFPLLSKMQDVRTYGVHGSLRRFIDLFREIHQVKT